MGAKLQNKENKHILIMLQLQSETPFLLNSWHSHSKSWDLAAIELRNGPINTQALASLNSHQLY